MEVARFFALKRLGFLHGDREGLHIRRSKGWSARNGSKPFLIAPKTVQSTVRQALITIQELKSLVQLGCSPLRAIR
jgi:hypothetical protein